MRAKVAALERDGCQVDFVSRSGSKITLAAACPSRQADNQEAKVTVVLKIETPMEFKVISTSNGVRSVLTSRWARECPAP
jgi:hypothetical protein